MNTTISTSTNFIERTKLIKNYLSEIRKDSPLSDEETKALVILAKAGDETAIQKLAAANQRFIFSLAKKRAGADEVMDLVNEGTIGLIAAINEYDETKNVKFLSYARFFILRQMNYYLTTTNPLIRKSNGNKFASKINVVKREFMQENGRYPSEQELADILEKRFGLPVQNLADLYELSFNSINSTIDDEENGAAFEQSPEFNGKTASFNEYENTVEEDGTKAYIAGLLSYLNQRERTVIEMAYGINHEREFNNDEIAEKMNLSPERIRQLIDKGLKTLRNASLVAKAN